MTIPDFLTRVDWDVPVEAVKAVAEEAGGLNIGIKDVEGILNMAERFESAFMRVGNKIMEMRKFEADGGRSDVVVGAAVQDQPEGERTMQAEPATGSIGATTGQITADKVYSVLLGALNEARRNFPDMTCTEMLEKARSMKSLIVPEIEAQLIKMATPEK